MSEVAMGKPGTNSGKIFDNDHISKISKSNTGKRVLSRRRFTEQQEKEICEKYISGQSQHSLANEYDCYKSTIRSVLVRNKIELRLDPSKNHTKPRFTIEEELDMCEKYQSVCFPSKSALAKHFGCRINTLRDILVRHNIIEDII